MKNNKLFFENLDGIRYLAFLCVVLQHAFFNTFEPFLGKWELLDRTIHTLFLSGGRGVQIFFVLSGFLITYLLLKEIEKTGQVNLIKFYIRRTLRIWPLYYVVVIFGFIIYPGIKAVLGIHSDLGSTAWYYFTFLSNFDNINIAENCPGKDSMVQGIVWSVSIEEQFYLFWPLLFVIFKGRAQIWGLISVILLSFLFKLLNYNNGTILYFHTLSVILDLGVGGLGAYLVFHNKSFLNFFETLKREYVIVFYILFSFIFFFDPISEKISQRLVYNILFLFFILEQNFTKASLFKFKNNTFFSFWGKYTYGLYLLHPIAILIMDIILVKVLKLNINLFLIGLTYSVLSYLISHLLAYISYKYFEQPFLRLKDKYSIL
jgi:peptidoglycan/LPS O-acetylase OafA/YrhL